MHLKQALATSIPTFCIAIIMNVHKTHPQLETNQYQLSATFDNNPLAVQLQIEKRVNFNCKMRFN